MLQGALLCCVSGDLRSNWGYHYCTMVNGDLIHLALICGAVVCRIHELEGGQCGQLGSRDCAIGDLGGSNAAVLDLNVLGGAVNFNR